MQKVKNVVVFYGQGHGQGQSTSYLISILQQSCVKINLLFLFPHHTPWELWFGGGGLVLEQSHRCWLKLGYILHTFSATTSSNKTPFIHPLLTTYQSLANQLKVRWSHLHKMYMYVKLNTVHLASLCSVTKHVRAT